PSIYTFSNVTANHTIRASFSFDQFSITASAGIHGFPTPRCSDTVDYSNNQAFSISANTGYHIDSVIVDGAKVDSTTSYTFSNVTANHTIRATFAVDQFTISASAGSHGSISPSGAVTVDYGNNQAF